MNRAPAACVAAFALLASACGSHRLHLPDGSGAPASDADARAASMQAGAACQGASTMSAVAGLSGAIRGQRVRGRLLVGTAPPASLRLELLAPFGQPLFVFVSRAGRASLLLPREDRVLSNAADYAVLDAVAGVPLETTELRAVLLGCADAETVSDVRAYGSRWLSMRNGQADTLYYTRLAPSSPWRLAAWVSGGRPSRPQRWRAEFSERGISGVPLEIGLFSEQAGEFALQLRLSDVELGRSLGDEVFELQPAASAVPVTLEEVRQSGPMAGREIHGR